MPILTCLAWPISCQARQLKSSIWPLRHLCPVRCLARMLLPSCKTMPANSVFFAVNCQTHAIEEPSVTKLFVTALTTLLLSVAAATANPVGQENSELIPPLAPSPDETPVLAVPALPIRVELDA